MGFLSLEVFMQRFGRNVDKVHQVSGWPLELLHVSIVYGIKTRSSHMHIWVGFETLHCMTFLQTAIKYFSFTNSPKHSSGFSAQSWP